MPEPRSRTAVGGLRVLAHPLRLRLLSLLTGAAFSAAEAARALAETQANVSYHLRRLHSAGLVELVEEIDVRGGRAKRYRHDPDSGGQLVAQSVEEHLLVAAALGEELRRRTADRSPTGEGELTDAELWLDPAGWESVRRHALALSEELHGAALPPHSPGAVRVSATMVLFEMTRGDEADGAEGTGEPGP